VLPGWQVECVGHEIVPQGTPKFAVPHTAPQGPQSSGQLAQLSLGSHVPLPHVVAGWQPAHVVRTPKAHMCFRSPAAGCGMKPVMGSGGLSDEARMKTSNAPGASGAVTESVAAVPLFSLVVFAPPANEAWKPPWNVSPKPTVTYQSARGAVDHPVTGTLVVVPGGSAIQSEAGDAL
jgi:hypothetical protein